MSAILFKEGAERRLAKARDEDRLVMGDQLYVKEASLKVDHDQKVDGRPRKAGQRGKVAGLQNIPRLGPARVQKPPDPAIIEVLAKGVGGHDQGGQLVTRQRRRDGSGAKPPPQDNQPQDPRPPHVPSPAQRFTLCTRG